jgi:hypothetical protein
MTSILSPPPQCISCIRRALNPFRPSPASPSLFQQQLRGKKKLVKPASTIKVKLLKDIKRYGPKGTVLPIAPGRMRNLWYPKGMATYLTDAQLKAQQMPITVAERDVWFGVEKPASEHRGNSEGEPGETLDGTTATPRMREVKLTMLSVSPYLTTSFSASRQY